jgi:hypothetical protein
VKLSELTERTPTTTKPQPPLARATILAALLAFLCSPSAASATGFSLDELVNSGGGMSSTDGTLQFKNFSAALRGGHSDLDLDEIMLVPLTDGFRLSVAPSGFLPSETELTLSYTVRSVSSGSDLGAGHRSGFGYSALSRAPIESMSIAAVGTSVLDAPVSAEMEAFDRNAWGRSATSIGNVQISGNPGEEAFDATALVDPASYVRVIAHLIGAVGVPGYHGNGYRDGDALSLESGTEMRFSTQQPIPEPSSALLVAIGLATLCSRSSRRRGRARP